MSLEKINVWPVVLAHFRTLRNARTGRAMMSDLALHVGVPLLAGGISLYAGVSFTPNTSAIVITALSVFVGLLFNLLVLASSLRMANRGSVLFGDARELSRQILVNIEFAILVAFAAIAWLLPSTFTVSSVSDVWIKVSGIGVRFASAAFVGLSVSFALTLLMVLRRMHVAMVRNMELTYDSAPEISTSKRATPTQAAG